MKTNFVLVDFENVQPKNISVLMGGPFNIKVFLGANQSKIPLEMAKAMHAFGSDAEYIQIDGSGRNALDFHVAYFLGKLTCQAPDAYFHVISKDTGFDPLIKHLRTQGILCQRLQSISDILLVEISNSETHEGLDTVIDNLAKHKSNRPRTLRALRSMINSRFRNQLTEKQLDALIVQLTQRAVIRVAKGKVDYDPPA